MDRSGAAAAATLRPAPRSTALRPTALGLMPQARTQRAARTHPCRIMTSVCRRRRPAVVAAATAAVAVAEAAARMVARRRGRGGLGCTLQGAWERGGGESAPATRRATPRYPALRVVTQHELRRPAAPASRVVARTGGQRTPLPPPPPRSPKLRHPRLTRAVRTCSRRHDCVAPPGGHARSRYPRTCACTRAGGGAGRSAPARAAWSAPR